ncbi:MAG: nucleotidyltransferase domain-containing protein [Caldilinea sp.]|nr:nucleotidyltransferase domain-containing protein [Caldilinea sp.]MCB9118665.1 nucleotidyltransferase domain-containing protein [Caldilineaceae bacterium]MCO5208200.1 nucleotidyltransferase domain-containing protein [Caldilinea sp.]MCW5842552.1 nucleotidyltransferase domain-containing protein [Caldilinea sp.]
MNTTGSGALSAEEMLRLAHYLAGQPDVLVAYLFGSTARGSATPLSDVDIAVLAPQTMSRERAFELRLALIDALQGLLHRDEIDVVVLNEAPLALRYRVLRDGKVLACRDEQVRILYQADTISRYLDFKPVIERHERAILERARRGELLNGHNPYRGALARYRQQRERAARTG